ncbi:MAG TPA: alpha/beta hydrolase [Rhizomicrobium sp.]|jgi:pimeloyl-ACP methyl ester carboxylesterase|nr:alpha/beta hydrolase [Rhizomicrobium sp.]
MAPEFPTPTMIRTNGIDMAVYEAGPKDGLPVVLCHGFPEIAYSWRYQIPALAAAGHRVLAPDQRGYGGTSRPEDVETYDMPHLTGDLVGMLDAFGISKAVFAGHDWGGFVVWHLPMFHPDRVAGVIGVNTPFLARPPVDPIMGMRAIYGENMYIVQFQKPGYAESILGRDVARTFRFFLRKNVMTSAQFDQMPKEMRALALLEALQWDEAMWPGEALMSPEELQVFVDTYMRTGFTGGINWYRNFSRNWVLTGTMEQKVRAPSLMIMAEDDVVLRPAMADGMERFVPDLEKVLIKNCGHWTQQEKPEETNNAMIDWLKRRFG